MWHIWGFCLICAIHEVSNWLIEKLFSLVSTSKNRKNIYIMVKRHQNCTYATSEYTVHLDVDECVSGNNNCLHGNANCTNTIGSYTCECKEGFTGNGVDCEGRGKTDFFTSFWRHTRHLGFTVVAMSHVTEPEICRIKWVIALYVINLLFPVLVLLVIVCTSLEW
jgi:hypothetical protein